MASHFRLGKCPIFTAQSVSSTTTYNTSAVHILNLDNVYLQINITGTPTGTFNIQVSNDHVEDQEGNIIVAGNWVTVTTASAAGSATSIGADLNQLGAPWFRLQYVNASSTGTLNAFVSGKGLM